MLDEESDDEQLGLNGAESSGDGTSKLVTTFDGNNGKTRSDGLSDGAEYREGVSEGSVSVKRRDRLEIGAVSVDDVAESNEDEPGHSKSCTYFLYTDADLPQLPTLVSLCCRQ